MAKLELINLEKHFGPVKAVDGVFLEVKEGEFLVFLGPSGSGKTTLMRLIAGLERPTRGRIIINGKAANDFPPRLRGIAMVFQSYALYPHKNVFKNIAFPLMIEKLSREEIRKRVEWAGKMLSIEHLFERMPSEISSGEKQRVAIARAIVRRPKVLLMDEPLSNLDAKIRHTAREELKLFQRDLGITTIYVTHDQAEAMGLGDRIAVMNEGKIRQIGTPEEIYHEPANTFVAGFIGIPAMNFIEQEGVILGFRPEAFLPKELIRDKDTLRFRLRVERIEDLGSNRLIYGRIGKTKVISNLFFSYAINEGEDKDFSVAVQDVRYFDKETGLRIK